MKNWTTHGIATFALISLSHNAMARDDDSGIYSSVAGLFVMQQDSDLNSDDPIFGDGEVEFEEGFGVAVALGFDLPALPLSIEFEYAYRQADAETLSLEFDPGVPGLPGTIPVDIEAELGSHTFMANAILNFQIEGTPVGLYGGAGVGFTLSTVEVASIAGLPVTGSDEEDDLTMAYQVRAGATFRLTDDIHAFAGIRWFDALEPDFDGIELENASVNVEFGVRLYF